SKRFKLCALTNNFKDPENLFPKLPKRLTKHFDFFIESWVIKMRKPDPRIFSYTCDLIKELPKDCLFLDDLNPNLRAAQKCNLQCIKVSLGNTVKAIKEMESITGVNLLDNDESRL
ncbi:Bifunctional epoxide hydrolase 2, partial [Lobulomyces angularis]